MNTIYLDNNSTTRPLPEVVDAMREALERLYANPSSHHPLGAGARRALEGVREVAATTFGAENSAEITFTSGGTAAIYLALSLLLKPAHRAILVSGVEHNAVLAAADAAAHVSCTVRKIPVDRMGSLDLDVFEALLKGGPALVSLAWANNETGVLFDLSTAAKLCRRYGAYLHVDAVQVPGRLALDLGTVDCDAVSVSAHKFHGPKGCGILIDRPGGNDASRGPAGSPGAIRHGGTENLPAILGTGAALVALDEGLAQAPRLETLRDGFEARLLATIPGGEVNGGPGRRLPQTSNFYFPDRSAAELVLQLGQRGICASAGAACSTGGEPSHVLMAMGLGEARAGSSLRFSFSRFTTQDEIDQAGTAIAQAYHAALPTYQY